MKLKEALCSGPVLQRSDFKRKFVLSTDWSRLGIGAVLSQVDEGGNEYAVTFASRSCNQAEKNYSTYDKECLAVMWGVVHFRKYLFGQSFEIQTDHQPLKWLMSTANLTGKFARIRFRDCAPTGNGERQRGRM